MLTEARNKVRLVRTELLPVKDRLAKYDLEHLNEVSIFPFDSQPRK